MKNLLSRSGDSAARASLGSLRVSRSPHPCPLLKRGRAKARSAFTLLEILLALALGALVLIAIGTAVSMNLRLVERGRSSTEEAQLARAVLNMIADDLRATVRYSPPDTEAINAHAESIQPSSSSSQSGSGQTNSSSATGPGPGQTGGSSNSSTGSGSQSGGSSGSSSGSSGSSGSSDSSASGSGGSSSASGSSSGSGDPAASEEGMEGEASEEASIPGLYGTLYELQLDVARSVRPDQPLVGLPADGATMPMMTSGVQRIRYYVDTTGLAGPISGGPAMAAGGLIRRQVDRAVASWAAGEGQTEAAGELIQQLAPEIAELEFYYYDGYEWLEEWNSTPDLTLPLAVEISIGILPRSVRETLDPSSPEYADAAATSMTYYKLVVHLPTAEAGTGTSSTTEEGEEGQEQQGSGSGTGGSNSSGSSSRGGPSA